MKEFSGRGEEGAFDHPKGRELPPMHEPERTPSAIFLALASAALCSIAFACGSAESASGGEQPDGPPVAPTSDASGPDADTPADAGPLPDGGGSGTIAGAVDGAPFVTVATAFVGSTPDSAQTTVVFILSKAVSCAELATPGWDRRITDGTQLLELKIFGRNPGTFTAVTTVTPAPGEASVNYTLSSTSAVPKEVGASGGTVTLGNIGADGSATGSFALKFGASSLDGMFNAINCPGGHEP
jgi:hypothetical protein